MQMEPKKEKLSFKPLHEGVGFHPFSDGLPYAPEKKVRSTPDYSQGSGAVSAGTPTFVNSSKTTRQIQQLQKIQIIQSEDVKVKLIPIAAPANGSLMRNRIFAYLLDTVIHLGFWLLLYFIVTLAFGFKFDPIIIETHWMGFLLFFIFSQWFFIAMQEVLFGNSLGKSFFNLEFKRLHSNFFTSSLFLRSLVFIFGAITFGLGFYFLPQDKIAKIQFKQS